MGSYSIRDINIVKRLDKAEKDLQYLKNRQFIGGKTLITHIVESAFYKSEVAVSIDGSNELQAMYGHFVFTADNQDDPYGRIVIESYKPDKVTIDDEPNLLYFFLVPELSGTGRVRYHVDLRGPTAALGTTIPYYTKATFYGSDTGRLLWEPYSW